MDRTNLFRSLFLMDETRNYTNNFYIFEFVKIVLFQEGSFSLSMDLMQQKITALTGLEYTVDDIRHAIAVMNNGLVQCVEDEYSLTPTGETLMRHRQKEVSIEKYIDQYLSINEIVGFERDQIFELIERFIYEKFNENLSGIESIFNHSVDKTDISGRYTEEEKDVINGFLNWDNADKNKCVFNIIAKSFDYCMVNSRCDEASLIFNGFSFYVDTNIIIRLLGLNNEVRQATTLSFIKKCQAAGIRLVLSNYVLNECASTISNQIALLTESTVNMNGLISPSSMSFAEESSVRIDFYKKYYEWCRDGHKHRDYEGFKRFIEEDLKKVLKMFDADEGHPSHETTDPEKYQRLFDSLYYIKHDKNRAKTDVDSVMLIEDLRRESPQNEIFFITADRTLVLWLQEIYPSSKSIADYPSVWFSILLKYMGREKSDDFKSFCQFLRLSVAPQADPDLERKIKIKASIMASEFDVSIKDAMIQEVRDNYSRYDNMAISQVVKTVHTETVEQIEKRVADEALASYNQRLDDQRKENDEREKAREEQFAIDKKQAQEQEFQRGMEEGEERQKQGMIATMVSNELKKRKRNRCILGIISIIGVIAIIAVIIIAWLNSKFSPDSGILKAYNDYAFLFWIIPSLAVSVPNILKWGFGFKGFLSLDEDVVRSKVLKKNGLSEE